MVAVIAGKLILCVRTSIAIRAFPRVTPSSRREDLDPVGPPCGA